MWTTTLSIIDHHQGGLPIDGDIGDRAFAPRRVRLNPEDFTNHGFTDGCRGCIWLQDNIGARVAQSEECRRRMEDQPQQSASGQQRIQRAKDRTDKWVADEIARTTATSLRRKKTFGMLLKISSWGICIIETAILMIGAFVSPARSSSTATLAHMSRDHSFKTSTWQ